MNWNSAARFNRCLASVKHVLAQFRQHKQGPVHIVRIDKVHHGRGGLWRIIIAHCTSGVIELAGCQSGNLVGSVVVVITPIRVPREPGDVLAVG